MTITITKRDFWTYLAFAIGIGGLVWSALLPSVVFRQTLVNDGGTRVTVTTIDLINAEATAVRLEPGDTKVVRVHTGDDTEREFGQPYVVIVSDADGKVISTTTLTGEHVATCSFHTSTATTRPIARD